MDLYIKQKIFTWGDKFYVYDRNGNEVYYVEGEVFSFGKKLHLYDMAGNELAYIAEQFSFWKPKYCVFRNGYEVAEIVKEFTFFSQRYTVNGLGWHVDGDFWVHEYEISDFERHLVSVSKEWFTLGDAYRIWSDADVDEVNALAVVLVIDACIEDANN